MSARILALLALLALPGCPTVLECAPCFEYLDHGFESSDPRVYEDGAMCAEERPGFIVVVDPLDHEFVCDDGGSRSTP